MRHATWTRRIGLAAAALALTATGASADCLRRIHNRSAYLLVASHDGGPAITVPPGRSATYRMARPATLALTARCPYGGGEAISERFDYEAVQDRCFIRFGGQAFQPQLGKGFLGTQGTAPFTVNNPRQGDVVLGPVPGACRNAVRVLSRKG